MCIFYARRNYMCFKAIRLKSKWILVSLLLCMVIVAFTYCKIENAKKKQIEELPKQVGIKVQEKKKDMAAPKIVQIEKVLEVPEKYNGYEVIAKLEIPKIELTTYVIAETTEETLGVSVTKLCGPDVNKPGNFCITRS